MKHALDEIDPTFVDDLHESEGPRQLVGRWFEKLGYAVRLPALKVRPHAAVRGRYADNGDVFVLERGRWDRYEVKGRKLEFTAAWNFPYATIFVDVCHQWDRAKQKPVAYFNLNRTMTHCAIVEGKTFPHWIRREARDNHANRTREFYECPKHLALFVRVPEGL